VAVWLRSWMEQRFRAALRSFASLSVFSRRGRGFSSKFFFRPLGPLNHFEHVHRFRLARCVFDHLRHRLWGLDAEQIIQASGLNAGLLGVSTAAQHKLNVALAASQLEFLGVLWSKQEGDNVYFLRFALRIRLDRLPGGKHFHVLQYRL